MKKFIVLMVIVALAGLASAEMLYNGNLDIHDPCSSWPDGWAGWGSGSGSGWNGWGGAATWNGGIWWTEHIDGTAESGDTYMEVGTYLSTGHSSWWGWAWCAAWGNDLQSNDVTAGDELTFSAYVRNAGGYTGTQTGAAILKIEWQDPCGVQVDANGDGTADKYDNPITYHDVTDDWTLISMTVTVPAVDPCGVPLDIAHVGHVWGTENLRAAVSFDTLSLVPEPASIALFGLGGTLLLRRRKK